MTQLRILAPVVVDYYAVPGAALSDPVAYARFWADRQPAVDRLLAGVAPPRDEPVPPPAFRLEHTRITRGLNLYRTISDHATERPLHVLTGTLRPEHLPGELADSADTASAAVHAGITEISFRLYDHGLMLLEMKADIGRWLTARAGRSGRPGTIETRLDELQAAAVAAGECVAREVVARYLDPVLDLLRRADRDRRMLTAPTPADDPVRAEFGEVLWVTRSLVVDPASPGAEQIVRHWVKDVVAADGERAPVERLLDGDLDHLVRWLNYVFMNRAGALGRTRSGDPFHDQWEALCYAQVFYGVLDRIDTQLSRILAKSAAATSRWELEQLRERLTRLSQRAELIIMERRDLAKYLKRAVRAEMRAILAFWDYENLLEQPVRFKLDLCDRRLTELAARRTARSAKLTDVILLGIAVTSILGTALTLSEFGRTSASDPSMAAYDLGQSAMVAWVASQPADAILIASAALSTLLVVVYLFIRRDHST